MKKLLLAAFLLVNLLSYSQSNNFNGLEMSMSNLSLLSV